MRLSALAATAAASMLGAAVAALPAAQADASSVYDVTKAMPAAPYSGATLRRVHPLADAVDVKRAWFGRDDAKQQLYMKMKVGDLLTPRQIAKQAPYATVDYEFGVSMPANDGTDSRLGFTLGTLELTKDKATLLEPRAGQQGCDVDEIAYDRATNVITATATYGCGLPADPTGQVLTFDVDMLETLGQGKPKHSAPCFEFTYQDVQPSAG